MKKMFLCFIIFLMIPYIKAEKVSPGVPRQNWSFKGLFGTFDRSQLQRGFQVYKEVCSACHGLNLLHYRNLQNIGYNEKEVKAIAAMFQTMDGPNDEGEMFERPRKPYDKILGPFANEKAARAANNGALPPDLSVIVKARKGGEDYLFAFLTGYKTAPQNFRINSGMHFNVYFPGNQTAMANPFSEGLVTYTDDTRPTIDQMARDVTAFLAWTSDPHQEYRKSLGLRVLLYLIFLSGLFYASMRRIWSRLS